MLATENRIVKKEDFARIRLHGKAHFSGNIELRVAENSLHRARIGLVVGLAFSKKAVERNEVKRWARAILRSYLPRLGENKDIVVIIRNKNSESAGGESIKNDLANVIEKVCTKP